MLHPWRSNVRELAAVLEQLTVAGQSPSLRASAIRDLVGERQASRPPRLTAERVQAALDASRGNQSQAARRLGISRGQLLRFLRASERGP